MLMNNEVTKPEGKKLSTAKWIAALVIATMVFYVAGRIQQSFRLQGAIRSAEQQLETEKMRTATLEQSMHLYEASGLMFLAALQLDQRNFGRAQERVNGALAAIQKAEESGFPVEEVSEVQSRLAQMNLVAVETELETQRSQLIESAVALNTLAGTVAIEGEPKD